ncbi:MAG: transcriptional antiterminator [Kiloniellaceae bacterium]|jgi:AmiR/NasT family two-component response regulator|nr:transcriptional antiterminator [Kiloniellaceae bacterium]
MTAFRTPNFRGWQVVVLHREDAGMRRLARQLERFGVTCRFAWPKLESLDPAVKAVFFDGDSGYDGLFPWQAGQPPVPLIALMRSEAPGRLEWVLAQGICSHLVKPVQSTGVYSALVLASHSFAQAQEQEARIAALKTRLRLRPEVIRTVLAVMRLGVFDEDKAYACIRAAAMERRMTVEAFCATADDVSLRALLPRRRQSSGLGRA